MQLVAVKVLRIEKLALSRAYQDYIKECDILHKARVRDRAHMTPSVRLYRSSDPAQRHGSRARAFLAHKRRARTHSRACCAARSCLTRT